jgi:hypothetical protein
MEVVIGVLRGDDRNLSLYDERYRIKDFPKEYCVRMKEEYRFSKGTIVV